MEESIKTLGFKPQKTDLNVIWKNWLKDHGISSQDKKSWKI